MFVQYDRAATGCETRNLRSLPAYLVVAVLLVLLGGCTYIVEPPASAEMPAAMSVEGKIANAMGAGPAELAANATILDWPSAADAGFPVLRDGTNGWSCLPDDPATPTDDPYCLDANWMEFLSAYIEGRDPEYTGVGLGYMLQGGSTADNDDPALMEPLEGQEWLVSGPHVMLVSPQPLDPELYTTDPTAGGPFIMWAGTPYEHLMIPVEEPAAMSVEDRIANAMGAGPAELAANATILDWPNAADAGFPVLHEGTNGWSCLPDDPATPTDDPYCLDANWMEFMSAYIEGRDPEYSGVGLGYMLQGGSTADNDDPAIMEPSEGQEWLVSGPHVMVVSPQPLDPALYTTDPMAGGPFIMWAGTPYEHLMIPIAAHPAP